MTRALIRHDALVTDLYNPRFYSIFIERVGENGVRVYTMRGLKRRGSRHQDTTFYLGSDLQKAYAVRESLLLKRLYSGYKPDFGPMAERVRRHLLRLGATHTELHPVLAGTDLSPEEFVEEPATGQLVSPTLRGRVTAAYESRGRFQIETGRSWLISGEREIRLVSSRHPFESWESPLGYGEEKILDQFAPFVIEGTHGVLRPSSRENAYLTPEFLPEDLVKIQGQSVTQLPLFERLTILADLLRAIDALDAPTPLIPPDARERLAAEAERAARLGELTSEAQALPLFRRLDAPLYASDARRVWDPTTSTDQQREAGETVA